MIAFVELPQGGVGLGRHRVDQGEQAPADLVQLGEQGLVPAGHRPVEIGVDPAAQRPPGFGGRRQLLRRGGEGRIVDGARSRRRLAQRPIHRPAGFQRHAPRHPVRFRCEAKAGHAPAALAAEGGQAFQHGPAELDVAPGQVRFLLRAERGAQVIDRGNDDDRSKNKYYCSEYVPDSQITHGEDFPDLGGIIICPC
jgi:hypothetical protein